MAGSSIGSLFVQLGFQADKTKLNDFIKSIGELDMRSIVAGLGLKGIQETIEKIMDSASGAAKDMNNFGKATGLSTQKMQQFGNFAEQMGVSSDEAMSSVKGLQDNLTKIRMGEGNIRPFALMGVSVTKDVWKTMDDIHKKMLDPRIPDAVKKTMIQEMGLSESMMTVLKSSDSQWATIKDQMFMTESQIAGVQKYNAAMAKFSQSWKMVMQDVAAFLAPMIEDVAEFVTQFSLAMHNSQKLRDTLIALSPVVAGIVFMFNPLLGVVLAIGAAFAVWHRHGEKIKETLAPVFESMKKAGEFMARFSPSAAAKAGNDARDSLMNFIHPEQKQQTGSTANTKNNNVTFNITGADSKEIAKKVSENMWWKNLGDAQFQDPAYT